MPRTATKPAAPAESAPINTARPPVSARPKGWAPGSVDLARRPGETLPGMDAWVHPWARLAVHREAVPAASKSRDYVAAVIILHRAWRVGQGNAAKVQAWALRAEAALAELTGDLWDSLDAAAQQSSDGPPHGASGWPAFSAIMERHGAHYV